VPSKKRTLPFLDGIAAVIGAAVLLLVWPALAQPCCPVPNNPNMKVCMYQTEEGFTVEIKNTSNGQSGKTLVRPNGQQIVSALGVSVHPGGPGSSTTWQQANCTTIVFMQLPPQ
jgi:hypothetical protein